VSSVPITFLATFTAVLVIALLFWAIGEGAAVDRTVPVPAVVTAAPAPLSVVVVTEGR
jgi:hypothetical protein